MTMVKQTTPEPSLDGSKGEQEEFDFEYQSQGKEEEEEVMVEIRNIKIKIDTVNEASSATETLYSKEVRKNLMPKRRWRSLSMQVANT